MIISIELSQEVLKIIAYKKIFSEQFLFSISLFFARATGQMPELSAHTWAILESPLLPNENAGLPKVSVT